MLIGAHGFSECDVRASCVPQASASDNAETQGLLSSLGLLLGYMHLDGEAFPRSNEKAVQWFRVAADNGSRDAEIALGWMFNTGQYG